jgi:hypothetical protein
MSSSTTGARYCGRVVFGDGLVGATTEAAADFVPKGFPQLKQKLGLLADSCGDPHFWQYIFMIYYITFISKILVY